MAGEPAAELHTGVCDLCGKDADADAEVSGVPAKGHAS